MWKKDDYSYTIKVELMGCNYFSCDYYKTQSQFIDGKGQETEKITTHKPSDLNGLELSIQNSRNISPETFELHCNGNNPNIDFATITVSATDYRIFDREGKEISLDKMKQWATDWWDSIQKMWDDQKNTNH